MNYYIDAIFSEFGFQVFGPEGFSGGGEGVQGGGFVDVAEGGVGGEGACGEGGGRRAAKRETWARARAEERVPMRRVGWVGGVGGVGVVVVGGGGGAAIVWENWGNV